MTKEGNTFNYTYTPKNLGDYSYNVCNSEHGCEVINFNVTSTGSEGSLIFLLFLTGIGILFFLAALWYPEEFFIFVSGVSWLLGGIYLMVFGLDVLNSANTRNLAFIYLAVGLLFTVGAYIYEWVTDGSPEEE
jgi:hypothetical protein